MYKNKEKQKQASKERQRRYRALRQDGKLDKVLRQGVTKGVTSEGVTDKALPEPVISKAEHHVGASQIKDVRALHKEIGQQTTPEQANVIPLEWPENEVTPKGARLLEEVFGKNLLETGLPDDVPRARAKGSTFGDKRLDEAVAKCDDCHDFVTSLSKPRATDPDVQVIWDGRNAQGQAAGYSAKAQSEDYPQTQRSL